MQFFFIILKILIVYKEYLALLLSNLMQILSQLHCKFKLKTNFSQNR